MTNTRESLIARLAPGGADECWLWKSSVNKDGYGRVRFEGKVHLAHRLFYTFFVGPIPDGKELDHTCHTDSPECQGRGGCEHRMCVNPAHLEAVVPEQNRARRRVSGPPKNAKTHCKNGHEFTEENTFVNARGYRGCRTCRRSSKQAYKLRQKSE
jgi:hypothetical protein